MRLLCVAVSGHHIQHRPSGETWVCLAGIQEQSKLLFCFWSASFYYDVTAWDREREKRRSLTWLLALPTLDPLAILFLDPTGVKEIETPSHNSPEWILCFFGVGYYPRSFLQPNRGPPRPRGSIVCFSSSPNDGPGRAFHSNVNDKQVRDKKTIKERGETKITPCTVLFFSKNFAGF